LSRCPVCGSAHGVNISEHIPSDFACLKCSSKDVVGTVRERSFDLAVVDWVCKSCGYKWSDSHVLPEGLGVGAVIWGS